ncbi:MAG: PD40 domain-containing protein [Acidobacteria bacterium]|nr:PD40 domain-containing protein [Acidobacteriota bacterium]
MNRLSLILVVFLFGPRLLAQDYTVYFTRQSNRVDNLYSLVPGQTPIPITQHPAKDSSPAVSPDGKTIAFTSERVGWWKIWCLDLTSDSVRQLTHSSQAEYAPCWSPDGQNLAFVSERDGNAEIYVMTAEGQNQRNLTRNPRNDTAPHWASDGWIYYSAQIDGIFQICKHHPGDGQHSQITQGPGDKLMPRLSPNHQTLLYYGDADGNPEIYTLELMTQNIRRLTDNPLQDIRAQWSPDGKKIVFERGNKKNNQHLFWMNADGSRIEQLTFEGYNYAPTFGP